MLKKKLNVNKGNAFGVKKNLFQVGEIESLSVHYERDSKESYAICRFVEAQIKLDAIKYATPFVFRAELEFVKMPRDSLAYPSLISSFKDLDKVYRGSWMKIMTSIRRREKALQINKEILMT